MEIKRIDHVVITTQDLEKCLAFYEGVLGMEHREKDGRHALCFGTSKFNIHVKKGEFQPAAQHPTYGSLDLCLIADGTIEEVEHELAAKGWPVELGIVKRTGAQGAIESIYVRDPDAQLDMIQLELTEDIKNNLRDGKATAWWLESSLREFENIEPVNFWFEHPIHRLDTDGNLGEMPAQGTLEAGRMKNSHSKTAEACAEEFRNAYQALNMDGNVTVSDMMGYLNVSDKTIYARLKKLDGEFILKKGRILKTGGASKASE